MRGAGTAALALLALLSAVGGCGDPVVVLGDSPGIMRIVAGVPEEPGATAEAEAVDSHLNTPRGLAVSPDGVLYIADQRNARILAVRSSGALEVVVDHRDCQGPGCLGRPDGLALAPDGRLVVADPGALRVWRVDPGTGEVAVLAGTGERGEAPAGTPAAGAPLGNPTGVAVDRDGTVYFSERLNHRIRGIDAGGLLFDVVGDGGQGFAGDGGDAVRARLSSPTGLAVSSRGLLYVADGGNHRVRGVSLAEGRIATVAGNGERAYAGDGGPAVEASLKLPEATAISPDGDVLLIGDVVDHRVRAVNLASGRISTFAGTGGDAFEADLLQAGETPLARPGGLAASDLGFLFVAAGGHHLVWRTTLDPF